MFAKIQKNEWELHPLVQLEDCRTLPWVSSLLWGLLTKWIPNAKIFDCSHFTLKCVQHTKLSHCLVLDFASVVWAPPGKGDSKLLERIQKRLLRYLYYRNRMLWTKHHIRWAIHGIWANQSQSETRLSNYIVSERHTQLESLLEEISFHIPPRISRKRNNLFNILFCRTKQFDWNWKYIWHCRHKITK